MSGTSPNLHIKMNGNVSFELFFFIFHYITLSSSWILSGILFHFSSVKTSRIINRHIAVQCTTYRCILFWNSEYFDTNRNECGTRLDANAFAIKDYHRLGHHIYLGRNKSKYLKIAILLKLNFRFI